MSEDHEDAEHHNSVVRHSSPGLAKTVAVFIAATTFLLPFYFVFYTNLWFQRYAFWYFFTEPNFGPVTYFIFNDPVSSFVFWLPEAYIAYETYNSARNRLQSRKRFLVKISIASLFLFICYALVILFSNPLIHKLLIPLPFATVISFWFGLKYYPQPIESPFASISAAGHQDGPGQGVNMH